MYKISHKKVKYQNLCKQNGMWWFVIPEVPHTKIQPPKSKTVAYKAYFAANFDFSTKPEVVFNCFKMAIVTH